MANNSSRNDVAEPGNHDDELSVIDSEIFNDLEVAQRGWEREKEQREDAILDAAVATAPKKRKGKPAVHNLLWAENRGPKEGQQEFDKWKHRIWYCKHCKYDDTNPERCYKHLWNEHAIAIDNEYAKKKIKMTNTIEAILGRQIERQEGRDLDQERALKVAINKEELNATITQLCVRRNLPFNVVEWPEFKAILLTVNYMATDVLPGRTKLRNLIDHTYMIHKKLLVKKLQRSLSKLNFAIDVWTSPTKTSLQATVVHFVDQDTRKPAKALLGLAEHKDKHGGEEQAKAFVQLVKDFEIKHQQIGFFVGDNHGSNDKMIRITKHSIKGLRPVEFIRIRCLGHIINLAAQAFLYGKNEEAMQAAIRQQAADSGELEDLEILEEAERYISTTAQWRKMGALGKLMNVVRYIRSSNARYQDFITIAGRQIPLANATRWNSWFIMLYTALQLRPKVDEYVNKHLEDLQDDDLTRADWLELVEYKDFLLPFWEATKQAEGDQSSLDEVLLSLDYLHHHYTDAFDKYKHSPNTNARVLSSWFLYDKYYSLTDRTPVYGAAILLHPGLRRTYLQDNWKRFEDKYNTEYVEPCVTKTRTWWRKDYAPKEPTQQRQQQQRIRKLTPFHQFRFKAMRINSVEDEFDRFIKAEPTPITGSALSWWLESRQQTSFPNLSRFAIDLFSIPPMSAEAERVFSGARRQVDWSRCRLKAETIHTIESLKHWLTSGITRAAFTDDEQRQQAEEAVDKIVQAAQEGDDVAVNEEEAAAATIIEEEEIRRQQEAEEEANHHDSDVD